MSRPRILLVRLGALGDVVLALPALRLLRRSLPDAGIGWLVEQRHADVLLGNRDLNAIFVSRSDRWRRAPLSRDSRREWLRLVRELRAERFDLAIDLQGLWKSVLWARLAGPRAVLGLPGPLRRERGSGVLLTAAAAVPTGSAHVTDLYLETTRTALRWLGVEPVEASEAAVAPADSADLLLPTVPERDWAAAKLRDLGLQRFVMLNPGAAWATKRWSPERFGALARELNQRHGVSVLVSYGPGEEPLAAAVRLAAAPFLPVLLPSTLRELIAVGERTLLFVSGDTGPYHIARALGVPTLGLFGPTDPARNGPRGTFDRAVWGRVPCSPCYGRECPTNIECMSAVELPTVLAAAAELLEMAKAAHERRAAHGGVVSLPATPE